LNLRAGEGIIAAAGLRSWPVAAGEETFLTVDPKDQPPSGIIRPAAIAPIERQPKVAAIVINFNGRDVTLQTLESLAQVDYRELEIIVVDNGSTDGSFAAVEEKFPGVCQVRKQVNEGVAAGMNVGVARALEGDCDYLLILNNDIEVDPQMISELVNVGESERSVGCVGPKTFYYGDRDRLWSAGGMLQFRESVTAERGMGEEDLGQYDKVQEVDYVNGCAMLVKRSVMERVGLFDPTYFVGIEDADWCMRMKRRGYRCAYTPHAVLFHMVSHTLGTYTAGRTFHTGRSTAIFVRRYATPGQWATFWLYYLAAVPLAYLRELGKDNEEAARSKWRGVMEGLKVPLTAPPAA
jgi:GT2 family glycosyltransferase